MAQRLSKKMKNPKKIIKRAKQEARQVAAAATNQSAEVQPNFNVPSGEYIEKVGRRKTATARVRIYQQNNGDFVVNDQLAGKYFEVVSHAAKTFNQPFELTGTKGKFAVTAQVAGSGISSQLDAVVHGLSRALVAFDPAFRTLLKEDGLLTRDPRMKETRKPGRGGKARRKRQSPKR